MKETMKMRYGFILVSVLILVMLAVQPAAAVINVSEIPTPAFNASLLNIDYSFHNGTYTQYWMNMTGGYPVYGFIYAIVLPFTEFFGAWFYAILWFLFLGMTYLRTGSVTVPVTIGLISGTVWGALMPAETYLVGYLLLAVSITVIIVKLYLRDKL